MLTSFAVLSNVQVLEAAISAEAEARAAVKAAQNVTFLIASGAGVQHVTQNALIDTDAAAGTTGRHADLLHAARDAVATGDADVDTEHGNTEATGNDNDSAVAAHHADATLDSAVEETVHGANVIAGDGSDGGGTGISVNAVGQDGAEEDDGEDNTDGGGNGDDNEEDGDYNAGGLGVAMGVNEDTGGVADGGAGEELANTGGHNGGSHDSAAVDAAYGDGSSGHVAGTDRDVIVDNDDGYAINEDGDIETTRRVSDAETRSAAEALSQLAGGAAQQHGAHTVDRGTAQAGLDHVPEHQRRADAAGRGAAVAAQGGSGSTGDGSMRTGSAAGAGAANGRSRLRSPNSARGRVPPGRSSATFKFSSTIDLRKPGTEQDPGVPDFAGALSQERPVLSHDVAEVGAAAATKAADIAHAHVNTADAKKAALRVVAVGDQDVLQRHTHEAPADSAARGGVGALHAAQQHDALRGAHHAVTGNHEARSWALQHADQDAGQQGG